MKYRFPLQESIASNQGVLSKVWAKFFANVESAINTTASEAYATVNVSNSTISTVQTEQETTDILTLYWMGV